MVAHQQGPRLRKTAGDKGRNLSLEVRTGAQRAVAFAADAESFPYLVGDPAGSRVIDFLGADLFRSAIDAVVVVVSSSK